jgi:hypothetical protein
VADALEKFKVAGAAVAVVKDGKVIHAKGYGWADITNKKQVTENTNFQIASNSKAFTTTALAILEDEEGMKTVTKALSKIVLAGGEQDSSLYRFRRLAQDKVYDLLQPNMYYNGGILRTLQVAEIAKKYDTVGIAPHTPKADPLIAPFWQVAALIPNLYGL